MKQGSTFVLVVDLQLDMSYVKSIIFTLKNKGKILTKEDWSFEDGKFKIPFSQEETVQLEGRTLIEAQINFEDGNVAKSEIKEIFIKKSLATSIVEGNKATEETQEIGLVIDGDVVYTDGIGGGNYNLPVANETTLGGVKPLNKTKEMTQEVGVDKYGRLFAKGKDITVDSELDEKSTNPIQNKVITAEVIALRERNAELEETFLKSLIKTTTSPSPYHHITDSANMKVLDFGMEGITEQETTQGNQLFDISKFVSNAHATNNGDGSITLTDYLFASGNKISKLLPNVKVGQTIIFSATTSSKLIYFGNTVKSFNKSFEVTQEMLDGDHFGFYGIDGTTTPDNPSTISDIMCNEGSTALPYEPYTGGMPSPNPTHQQDIELAGVLNEETGRYEHKCCVGNKNLFYKANENRATCDISLKAGTVITCSAENDYGGTAEIHYTDGTKYDYGMNLTTNERKHGIAYVVTKDVKQIMFRSQAKEPQVEIGGLTDYKPFTSQPFTLTSDRPLTKWDKLVKRDGVYGWSIWDKTKEFTGNEVVETFYQDDTGMTIYQIYVENIPQTYNSSDYYRSYCEKFYYVPGGKISSKTFTQKTCYSVPRKNFVNFASLTSDGIFESADTFKQYLKNEKVRIMYRSDTEVEFIPLPEEEQTLLNNLETYYGVTNVYNEQGCPISLTYISDPKLYVDQKLLQIQQAMI